MKNRPLGKTGMFVSEIGLGTWEMGGTNHGKKDDRESIYTIHSALDHGVNFIDTAADYGGGHSEEIVGKALKQWRGDRSQIVVSTKLIPKCEIWSPSLDRDIGDFFPPEWIFEQCEKSLKRLQLEKIDVLFLHTWSPSWGHHSAWFDAMNELKQQGKIRAIGISISDDRISEANVHIEAHRVDVIQCVYNIFQQEPEYTLFPLARKHEVGIVARSPFNAGALIGEWSLETIFPDGDWRGVWPQDIGVPDWLERQVTMVELVKPIIQCEGLDLPIAALKFVLMNSTVSTVIPGTANPNHAIANAQAGNVANLSDNIIDGLKKLWLEGKVFGFYVGSKS